MKRLPMLLQTLTFLDPISRKSVIRVSYLSFSLDLTDGSCSHTSTYYLHVIVNLFLSFAAISMRTPK